MQQISVGVFIKLPYDLEWEEVLSCVANLLDQSPEQDTALILQNRQITLYACMYTKYARLSSYWKVKTL